MSEIRELANGLFWVGARHPELKIFDELFPTRQGSTYNAYLVRGTDKVALIDTVKAPFAESYLERVQSLAPVEKIDLVVVNHTEPDHSGALGRLLDLNPEITICCTRAGENFLRQLYDRPMKTHIVSDGEEIDLGGRTLKFFLAPYLHWPDTMFTYLVEEKILFPCDAFGAHFCGDGLFDDEVADFSHAFRFYFDTIMRPFKDKIREAVAKVEGLGVKMICPSHGPLLRRDPQSVIDAYKELAAPPPASDRKRVLVLTLSPHGNTRAMAAVIGEELTAAGLEVIEHSLVELDEQALRTELERTDVLLVGSPTINRDAPPPVWQALALISTVSPKGRLGAAFGSYGWSGEAVKLVEQRLEGLKYQLLLPGLTFRFRPTEGDIETCRDFGRKLAERILAPA